MFRSVAIATLCLSALTAQAASIIFRDGTDFRSTLMPTTFESFEDEALSSGATLLQTTYFSVATTPLRGVGSQVGIFNEVGWAPIGVQYLGGGSETGDPWRLDFTLAFPVTAVGFYVIDASEQEALIGGHRSPSALSLLLPSGETFEISACPPCLGNLSTQYFGVYTPGEAFSSFSILNTANDDGIAFDGMSLLAAPVPIPAAVWLFGSAFGLMGLLRRRAAA
jgi:hypothetical protein